jgi:hypothetical protein
MGYWGFFLIGAGIGAAQLALSLLRRPIFGGYPFQAFGFAGIAGGAIYGTILWLLFG